jgi:hypothetical protein
MRESIPIRVSAALAEKARTAAEIQDRSLTEQLEHWARLGQAVESAVLSSTVSRLKHASYDERLLRILDTADTPRARKRAARSIAGKNPFRYGITAGKPGKIIKSKSRHPSE